ncbi:hypothetical protein B0I37DRAFT_409109 [Chaetomium sp. MPI-CAGE-AT-0009]|nr:hypothetical protein B0I37DRAFT_409109 [Chaetomium sp. MPI-CAGE-AT-0009]
MALSSQSRLLMLWASLGSLLVLPKQVAAQETSPGGDTFPDTAWNCSGWHTVVSGDDCSTVQKQYNITADKFFEWNPSVSEDCLTNFWLKNSYCVRVGAPGPTMDGIAPNCNKWHTVVEGDDCSTIEKQYDITADQFFEWNPAVSKDCITNFWLKSSYCVGINKDVSPSSSSTKGSTRTTTSSASSSTRSVVTTTSPYSTRNPVTSYNESAPYTATAFPPQHTQPGQPANCNRWHWAAPGESCEGIVNLYGARLTEEQLHEYNPTLGEDCSGLYFGWYICIGVQSQSSSSIGWYTSQDGNASIPEPTEFVRPPATYVQNFTAQPQQSGIPTSCQNFYQAESGDTCNTVLGIYNYITKDQFFAWNPALSENCNGLLLGVYYCVANFASTYLPMPPTLTASASPTATGTTQDCKAWYLAVGNDDCASISLSFGTFSESDFISWNPSVRSDCSNLKQETYYCVAIPGTPTTRTEPAPTAPGDGSSLPTQRGIAPDCTRYWLVSRDDTCASITSAARISASVFHAWNPAVGADCAGLAPDYYVCVSTGPVTTNPGSTVTLPGDGSGGPTTTRAPGTTKPPASSSAPSSTTASPGEPVTTPSPAIPGMVDGCVRFFFRGPDAADLYCYDLAAAAGISLDDFYAWNAGVGTDCAGLWADTWYCIGVSGPHTTISSGTPKPPAATP